MQSCAEQPRLSCVPSPIRQPAAIVSYCILVFIIEFGVQGPAVLLVMQGAGEASAASIAQLPHTESAPSVKRGDVFFLPCDTPVQLTAGAEAVRCCTGLNLGCILMPLEGIVPFLCAAYCTQTVPAGCCSLPGT